MPYSETVSGPGARFGGITSRFSKNRDRNRSNIVPFLAKPGPDRVTPVPSGSVVLLNRLGPVPLKIGQRSVRDQLLPVLSPKYQQSDV
jgi:hypothetical protein